MIIARLVQVSPIKLYTWSKSRQWRKSLKQWGHRGKPFLEGDAFYEEVKKGLVRRSLKKAGQLWMELFGLTELQGELHRFLSRFEKQG